MEKSLKQGRFAIFHFPFSMQVALFSILLEDA
jgi:hypothetical protein